MKRPFPPYSAQTKKIAALFGIAAIFSVTATANSADPHQHGVGKLNVAVQGDHLEIEIETPGADIVGFENKPKTEEQRRLVQDAAKALRDAGALFVFPATAGCILKDAEVESDLLVFDRGNHGDKHHSEKHHDEKHHDEKHHDEKHHSDKHDEEVHAEFHAHYHFVCENPLTHVDLRYFEMFPRAEVLSAQTLTATGQRKQKLTRKDARLNF